MGEKTYSAILYKPPPDKTFFFPSFIWNTKKKKTQQKQNSQ